MRALGILLLATTAMANAVQGSSVLSPFQLEMNRAELNEILARSISPDMLQGKVSIPVTDLALRTPFTVTVSGVQVNLSYKLAPPSVDAETLQWSFKSDQLGADITIQRIDATQVIHEQVGGIQMDVRLTGYCSNVRISLTDPAASANARGSLDFSDVNPRFQLSGFSALWAPGSWHLDSMTCQGPQGFDTLVRQNVETALRDPASFQATLRDHLQQWIDQKLGQPFSIPVGQAQVSPRSFEVSSRGAHAESDLIRITGQVRFVFPELPSGSSCDVELPQFGAPPVGNGSDSLVVPSEAAVNVLRCAQLSGALSFPFDSTRLPGFRSLEQSRFKQMFVWPDLITFDEDTMFRFSASFAAPPVIGNERSEGAHKIAMDVVAGALVEMSAPDGGQYVPYVHFSSPLAGTEHLVLENGMATIRLDSADDFKLNLDWDTSYLDRHPLTNRLILKSSIEGAVHKLLTTSGLQIPLPSAPLSDGSRVSLRDGDLRPDGNLLLTVELSRPTASNPKP